jgi:hypothetical protein
VSNADLTRLLNENARMETQLKSFENKIPISELKKRIDDLEASISDSRGRIRDIKSSDVPVVTKEEWNKVS